LAARLGSRVSREDLVEILGDKDVYSYEDALSIHKRQWTKQQYLDAMDVQAGYTRERLFAVLPDAVTPDQVLARLGDKPVYGVDEVKAVLGRRWRRALSEQADISAGYTKARMLQILRERATYVLARGTTLNNPHISKSFFDGFEKITANHAMRVREMVAEAEQLAATGTTPEEAAAIRRAAEEAIPDPTGSASPDQGASS
jgi:hypothetical protein